MYITYIKKALPNTASEQLTREGKQTNKQNPKQQK